MRADITLFALGSITKRLCLFSVFFDLLFRQPFLFLDQNQSCLAFVSHFAQDFGKLVIGLREEIIVPIRTLG